MLLDAVHKHFYATPDVVSAIPGGLVLDFTQDASPQVPYAVFEDAGSTRLQTSTGDGPTDQNVTCWVFGNIEREALQAARVWADSLKDATLTLEDGSLAYADLTSVPKTVTDTELMKDAQTAFQVSFDMSFQM